ncbi:hypothetical protein AAFA72_001017 [Enterococcus faecalis]|nr:hypothetical protein [Enterococcus faecalis]HBI1555848.1 hypothetical protein [Enterococcus faecalis]HBI1558911.1 hypothetical protein [Enterococcus faecalis]HBI1567804.1 hypothetical protein [Enterococcus faecalis]
MRRKRGRKPLILLTSVATIGFGISLLSWFETEVQAQDATLVVNAEKEEVKPSKETSFTVTVTQDREDSKKEESVVIEYPSEFDLNMEEIEQKNEANVQEIQNNPDEHRLSFIMEKENEETELSVVGQFTKSGYYKIIANSGEETVAKDIEVVEDSKQFGISTSIAEDTNSLTNTAINGEKLNEKIVKNVPDYANSAIYNPRDTSQFSVGITSVEDGARNILRPGDTVEITGLWMLDYGNKSKNYYVFSLDLSESGISWYDIPRVNKGAELFSDVFTVEKYEFLDYQGNKLLGPVPFSYELYGRGQFDLDRSPGTASIYPNLAGDYINFKIQAKVSEDILEILKEQHILGRVTLDAYVYTDSHDRLAYSTEKRFDVQDYPLVFQSAPSSINFGQDLKISNLDKAYPVVNSNEKLIVTDKRTKGSRSWRMKATLQQQLTSTTNVEHKLPDALHYKKQGQDLPLVLNESQIIYEKKTDSDAPVVISDEWSGIENGPVLEVKAGKAYAESYGGSVRWTLEDVPSNQG